MHLLAKYSTYTVLACSFLVADVTAEQAFDSFPQSFPGSAGFPEPMEPPSDLPPAYPEWPERLVHRRSIPPPPPGPYMSSALSAVDAFPADTGGLRNEFRQQEMRSPFFEPDMPWPETPDRGQPEAWVPEGGEYRFVPDDVVRQLDAMSPGRRQHPMMYRPQPGYPPPAQYPGYDYR